MQYGNYIPHIFCIFLFFRLNRTMQYGNKRTQHFGYRQSVRFKSYYVVWKLRPIFAIKKTGRTFKSYYVVWKLCFHFFSYSNTFCLNRTMQYGNLRTLFQQAAVQVSLNRTMQYGNYDCRIRCISILRSLNRTMQYGNA